MNTEPPSFKQDPWQVVRPFVGRPEIALALFSLLWLGVQWLFPFTLARILLQAAVILLSLWVMFRLIRRSSKMMIWRLRNRLMVAYLFTAVVPIFLLIGAAVIGAQVLSQQVAIYLISTEFDRHISQVRFNAQSLIRLEQSGKHDGAMRLAASLADRLPGFELLLTKAGTPLLPQEPELAHPPKGWKDASGLLVKEGYFYIWTHQIAEQFEVTLLTPVSQNFLGSLVPHLGKVTIFGGTNPENRMRLHEVEPTAGQISNETPPAMNKLDLFISYGKNLQTAVWETPQTYATATFGFYSHISALFRVIFSDKADFDESSLLTYFYAILVTFLIIQVVSVIIGSSLSRSITGAVHDLYQGTLHVQQGDFKYKIPIKGRDQLASLSTSFNEMTTKVEQLLIVAKQQERIVAELEIARAVQAQLYPTRVPESKTFHIEAKYNPALSVSGDYYDYQPAGNSRIAVAIGDVAGKGISAALLMAALASTIRTQLRFCLEAEDQAISTSKLVGQLNKHLYANTTPEKYATFFLGVYDENTEELSYTNAGHLQPLLIRKGIVEKLEINGMVVGLFPAAAYTASVLKMLPGDLIIFYTDGVTEPEDAYDEMFGEERLADLVTRNAHLPSGEILQKVSDAVDQWTHDPAHRDDLTLLIVRRT